MGGAVGEFTHRVMFDLFWPSPRQLRLRPPRAFASGEHYRLGLRPSGPRSGAPDGAWATLALRAGSVFRFMDRWGGVIPPPAGWLLARYFTSSPEE